MSYHPNSMDLLNSRQSTSADSFASWDWRDHWWHSLSSDTTYGLFHPGLVNKAFHLFPVNFVLIERNKTLHEGQAARVATEKSFAVFYAAKIWMQSIYTNLKISVGFANGSPIHAQASTGFICLALNIGKINYLVLVFSFGCSTGIEIIVALHSCLANFPEFFFQEWHKAFKQETKNGSQSQHKLVLTDAGQQNSLGLEEVPGFTKVDPPRSVWCLSMQKDDCTSMFHNSCFFF